MDLATYALARSYADKALSPEKISTATDAWLSEHVDPETGYVLDSSLTMDNAAAPAGKVGEFVEEIREDYYNSELIDKTFTYDYPMPNSGRLNANGTITSSDTYYYGGKIPVQEGDIVTLSAIDSNYGVRVLNKQANRLCCYLNNVVVPSAGSDAPPKPITIPSGVDAIVITLDVRYTDVIVDVLRHNYTEYTPKIDEVESDLTHLVSTSTKKCVIQVEPEIVTGKYVDENGVERSSASYYYFNINVQPGDVISNIRTLYMGSTSVVIHSARFICAYNGIGTAVADSGAQNVGTYTVPDNIVKLAITIDANYPLADHVSIYRDMSVTDVKSDPKIASAIFASKPQEVTGDLAASSSLAMTTNSVKKNKEIIFSGKISTFNKISVGQGTNDLNGEKIEIDGTNLVVYRGTDSTGVTVAHGLTIADYITVTIFVDNNHIAYITIMTSSGQFTYTTTSTYVGCSPNIYATTDASTALTDCRLSFVCNDIKESVWIFGDSYVSYTSDRWIYYIEKMGYTKHLLNGFSGQTSGRAIMDLNNLLNYGTPKYIVWALGMNDADGGSIANEVWKSCYDEVVALCNEKGITPIFCTIPNVPSVSHVYKNQIIMESDYQYINFADAVGALDDTTWYTGMLSNDNVHPTVTGGIALASQALKDFPLICIV